MRTAASNGWGSYIYTFGVRVPRLLQQKIRDKAFTAGMAARAGHVNALYYVQDGDHLLSLRVLLLASSGDQVL